jgi:hypothetical protein
VKCLLKLHSRRDNDGRLGYGNCRAVETVEKRTACFSTVPTALGKLGKNQLRRVSTVPTAPTTAIPFWKRRKKAHAEVMSDLHGQIRVWRVKTI